MSLSRFKKVYDKLPPNEREMPIIIIRKQQVTWDKAYDEIKKNSVLGKKIIKKLIETDII